MPQRSPQTQALIAQGFLQIDEKKQTYRLGAPIGLWLVDRATRDALGACMRAATEKCCRWAINGLPNNREDK